MFEKIKGEVRVLLQTQVMFLSLVMFLSRKVEAADISYFLSYHI